MKASELIGKLATRTAPTKRIGDYSFTDEPLLILYADDTHIVYNYVQETEKKMFGDKERILRVDFCDDNWRDYQKMIDMANEVKKSLNLQEDKLCQE